MLTWLRRGLILAPACLFLLPEPAIADRAAEHVSEKDYFGELPVVLSVSRLAQPLNEVPGAVTVIDRELIRRSGAREVAELLRLVPGFLLTYRNGANPLASYHAGMDVYGSRMQVYVDGRSLYSSSTWAIPTSLCAASSSRTSIGSRSCAGRIPLPMGQMPFSAWSIS